MVNDLLENGVSVNAKHTTFGSTALHVAARHGMTEMVRLLMLKGADKDTLDNYDFTPLYTAAYNGHVAATQALLAGGADVNIGCGAWKAPVIHAAVQQVYVDILRAVIDYGADVNAADTEQRTALVVATQHDNAEAIGVLVEAGANVEAPNSAGKVPLHAAAAALRLEALTALLRYGAHVNVQTVFLVTPLHCAAARAGIQGAAEVVDVLLRSGADETIVDDEAKTAADVVAFGVEEEDRVAEDVERVRQLLKNATADRAWLRRGYLVLCRAHPERVKHASEMTSSSAHTGSEDVGGCAADEITSCEWTAVVPKILELQEEGIFRTILRFL